MKGEVPKLWITFQRSSHEVLPRHEHHDIVRRIIKLALIGLGPQRLDMPAHRLGMELQVPFALDIIVGLERRLIGVERDLGVDHQLFLPWHMDNRIGAQTAILGLKRMLQIEIGVLG